MADPVNLTNLREMTEGDVEMENALFDEFYSSTEACIKSLENHCADGADEMWRSSAHALKGTCLNLGAEHLSQLCRKAQESHAASQAEKQSILAAIREEYQKVRIFLGTRIHI